MFLSVLFMPFWVSVILALAGMAYFRIFWEVSVLFLLSDMLYGTTEAGPFDLIFASFVISIVLLVLVEILKKRLRFYPK